MQLKGLDGTQYFGFMAALGTFVLLDQDARRRGATVPRMSFGRDGTAVLGSDLPPDALAKALFRGLDQWKAFLVGRLTDIGIPADLGAERMQSLSTPASRAERDFLSGLACAISEQVHESTLCAANGAGHQKLVVSMRDVLDLLKEEHIETALFAPWQRSYVVPSDDRKRLALGARKPTLRLDPADERLYALRATNPTTSDDFRTELGAQALAIPAFTQLAVVPSRRPATVASKRERQRVYFHWPLWEVPCTLTTVRSLIVAGVGREDELRQRGAFMALRVARVAGDKGKLSFAPTEGVW